MELPNDIWDIIVKQSKKSNEELVKDMDLEDLLWLEHSILQKKMEICDAIKYKIDKYDVIEINMLEYIVADTILSDHRYIKCFRLIAGDKKTIFGNYQFAFKKIYKIDLYDYKLNIKIKSKYQDRYRENINIANKLKVGDVFCYSLYTGAEWCKMRCRIYEMDTFEDGLFYGVVNTITPNKIVMVNYHKTSTSYTDNIIRCLKYVDKSMILNKINYEDNTEQYINMKKKFMYMCMMEIDKIYDNKDYFENVNKNDLIQIQKRLKIIK
jgi:hypothetical protein